MAVSKRVLERRKMPRIPVNFGVTVTCEDRRYNSQAREFSESGVFVSAEDKGLVGKLVMLDLALTPQDSALSLKGVVVYATESGVGIRFRNPSRDQLSVLKNFIRANG
jgi:hypothetical protein